MPFSSANSGCGGSDLVRIRLDGKLLASAADANTVRVLEAETGQEILTFS